MKLYKYLFLFFITLFIFAFVQDMSSFSDGPPPSRTSAPGELNCSNGYCHNSFVQNTGPGEVSLSGEVLENGFRAGQTYTLQAKVKHTGQQRFGFMVVAYDSVSQVSGGQIALTQPERTQLTLNQEGDRTYVTHKPANITADSSTWTFDWTAPTSENSSAAISFYAAFVAANNNGNSSGDYVYTARFDAVLDTSWATSIDQELSSDHIRAWFDTYNSNISIESKLGENAPLQVEILNLNAQKIHTSAPILLPNQTMRIGTIGWTPGIYILKLQQGSRSRVHKFRIIR